MCGRFAMAIPPNRLREMFKTENIPLLKARYNISPGQDSAVLFADRTRGTALWGIQRAMSSSGKRSAPQINSRTDTFLRSLANGSVAGQPCLVPASGFYEFTASDGRTKQPWYFTLVSGEPMAFAGIVREYPSRGAGERQYAFSILTTDANDCVRQYHQRMPVILPENNFEFWLSLSFNAAKRGTELLGGAAQILTPLDPSQLTVRAVSQRVNDAKNDSLDLIETVELKPRQPGLFDI